MREKIAYPSQSLAVLLGGILLLACQRAPEDVGSTPAEAAPTEVASAEDESPEAPSAYPRSKDPIPEDTFISLERNGCFGTCPKYTVTVNARGETLFHGENHVARLEEVEGQIHEESVRWLLREFELIDFFDLEDRYDHLCDEYLTCNTTVTIELRLAGRSKTVSHYYGCRGFDKEQALKRLQQVIDDVTWASQWVGKPEERKDKFRYFYEQAKKSNPG